MATMIEKAPVTLEVNNIRDNIRGIGTQLSRLKALQIKNALNETEELKNAITAALDGIELSIAQLPGTDYLWATYCSENLPESFKNVLAKIRQRANSWQKHLIRVQDLAISELKKKIKLLGSGGKDTFNDDFFALKADLKNWQDNKVREQMLDWKVSEIFNVEKPSKHFLDIAAKTGNKGKLSDIKDNSGNDFLSEDDRTECIKNFYENLYEYTPTHGSIENFLGPSICESELVKNSKLTKNEKNWLDNALDIAELDESLSKSNFKSAPGRDGFSNVFIRHFWSIFRRPLYDVAVHGLSAGALPGLFQSADIKLIPKKDNTAEIKNWRPISLLSNFYKIVSRAINNRLKKIAPRILSRAQKGFVPGRYMHEVLINILNKKDYCETHGLGGFLVSADLKKAFDSVSHEFMEKCYDFFKILVPR
jgi:hypothetical protein